MRVWATIYNFFAVLLLLFMFFVLYNDIKENERQLQEIRLQYAVDYATEGAFQSSLEGGNLGIKYEDLQNVKIVPENTLVIFKSILALSYDMSLSSENLSALDTYISSAVLAVDNGYYLATPQKNFEVKEDKDGKEFEVTTYNLKWGLKKPYSITYSNNRAVAYNISSQKWVLAKRVGNSLEVTSDDMWMKLQATEGIEADKSASQLREKINTAINQRIMDDINYNIRKRNEEFSQYEKHDFIYLPSTQTASGVNTITKPSMLVSMSGVDFAGTQRLSVQSVGGYTIAKKRRVIGFTVMEGGREMSYYAYEGQVPDLNAVNVKNFYNTVDEAAREGFRPHVVYLKTGF